MWRPLRKGITVRVLKCNKGTMLIDVMIAIYMLAVVGVIYAATVGVSAISQAKADQLTKATVIANREMESIKNVGYGNATYAGLAFYKLIDTNPGTPPYGFNTVGATSDRVGSILPSGTGTVYITDISTTMRQIIVTVTWQSVKCTRSVVISSELADLN